MKKASQKYTHQTRLPPTDVIEEPQLVNVNDTHSVSEAETLSIKADPLIGFCTSFRVNIISIFLGFLCCSNNSVIWHTRQHMAAIYDQRPLLRGDWNMQMSQC